MTSSLCQVDLLRCYGSFGSVDKWHGFEFRVYADGTVTTTVERALKHAWRDPEEFEDDEEVDAIAKTRTSWRRISLLMGS